MPRSSASLGFVIALVLLILVSITIVRFISFEGSEINVLEHRTTADKSSSYTLVVNAFRRDDRLIESLDHYNKCPKIAYIYVIWNDITREIPASLLEDRTVLRPTREVSISEKEMEEASITFPLTSKGDKSRWNRVAFFVDETNVISNRFKPRPFVTDAVFTVDDDMLYDCDTMSSTYELWRMLNIDAVEYDRQNRHNKNKKKKDTDNDNDKKTVPKYQFGVGFAPRKIDINKYLPMAAYKDKYGKLRDSEDTDELGQRLIRYYEPSSSYATGNYNTLFVTKGAFLHKNIFNSYFKSDYDVPRALADAHTTGEDLLMSAVCWQEGVRMVPVHYRNLMSKLTHFMFTEENGKQKEVSLSKRTSSWRPLIMSSIIETILVMNKWETITDVPLWFAFSSDLWYVKWFLQYIPERLSGALMNPVRVFLFDLRYFGVY